MGLGTECGYTLIEAIIAIAICGFGLAAILGLYGVALETQIVSENIFEQSLEINSISDEILRVLPDPERVTLSDKANEVLQKYPNYRLEEIIKSEQSDLYIIKISQKGIRSQVKYFWIKVFWRSIE